jgi:hypothetical protein
MFGGTSEKENKNYFYKFEYMLKLGMNINQVKYVVK